MTNRPLRLDPDSIMASPEKAELVDAIHRACIQRHIEKCEALIRAGEFKDYSLGCLLADYERGDLEDPGDPHYGRNVVLTRGERAEFKRLATLAIEMRGGRFIGNNLERWIADTKGLRRSMA